MMPSYMKYPFMNQYPYIMYPQQPQMMPIQQCPQQFMPMTQYPMPAVPYGMPGDMEAADMAQEPMSVQDPPPVLSNNPIITNIVFFKELTGYPNYGNPSRNADILYTGNRGTWTFDTPAFLLIPTNLRAQIVIRAVLDDHSAVPTNRYSARITVNGSVVHNGVVPLEHGVPAGSMFTNWRSLTFNIPIQRRLTRVTIDNTSTAGTNDWIGLDWMEVRLLPR